LLIHASKTVMSSGRLKMQDWNLTDQIAGLENAGPENAGQNVFDF